MAELRLAMLLPFIPSESLAHKNRINANERVRIEEDSRRRDQFYKLHEHNIGSRLVQRLLDTVGPELTRYAEKGVVHSAVVKFCRAYGYDANELRWAKVLGLWYEGVPGYEGARLDGWTASTKSLEVDGKPIRQALAGNWYEAAMVAGCQSYPCTR